MAHLQMTDSLVVLVPVLDRPARVVPLIESFVASGAPEDSVLDVLLSPGDTATQAVLEGYTAHSERWAFMVDAGTTWPSKITRVMEAGRWRADWFLLAADDVTFELGWWQATARLRAGGFQVIGTNDGANPRCSISGIHTTHPLVHRDFHAMGHPSSPVWPGYHHWFVDDELVNTAKARGVWAWCEGARVTHHHPYFDESVEWDATYALGESKQAEDLALWSERCQLLGLRVGG